MEAHELLDPLALPLNGVTRDAGEGADAGSRDCSGVAAGLTAAARALGDNPALGPLLGAVAAEAARALGARRCVVYLREPGSGDLVGTIAHDFRDGEAGSEWIARERVSADTPGLARVLEDGEPAIMTLPATRSSRRRQPAGRERSLVVPMVTSDGVAGVLVLSPTRGTDVLELGTQAQTFAALAGAAVVRGRSDASAARQRNILAQRLKEERRAAAIEQSLWHCMLESVGPAPLANLVATSLELPCVIRIGMRAGIAFDAGGRPATVDAFLDSDDPDVVAELSTVGAERVRVLGPYPRLGIHTRHLVARVAVPDGPVLLAIEESERGFTGVDARVVERAAALLGLQLRERARGASNGRDASAALVRDAVHASDSPASLRARSARLGISLEGVNMVCLLADPAGAEVDVDAVRDQVDAAAATWLGPVASVPGGAVMIAALDPKRPRHAAVATVAAELERVLGALASTGIELVATASSVCRDAEHLPRALAECRELVAYVLGSGSVVLCADDLGAGRLMLGQLDGEAAQRFADEVLGAVAADPEAGKLIETLEAFFAANTFVRATAADLQVHENTVRHRFRRLASLTGHDVLGSADDQLTVRLALTIRKLHANAHMTKEQQ